VFAFPSWHFAIDSDCDWKPEIVCTPEVILVLASCAKWMVEDAIQPPLLNESALLLRSCMIWKIPLIDRQIALDLAWPIIWHLLFPAHLRLIGYAVTVTVAVNVTVTVTVTPEWELILLAAKEMEISTWCLIGQATFTGHCH